MEQPKGQPKQQPTQHGECKTPGGKLVAVDIVFSGVGQSRPPVSGQSWHPGLRHPASCHLSGDFFVEGESDAAADSLLRDIERALIEGRPVASALAAHPDVALIGTSAAAIETAFDRALDKNACTAQPAVMSSVAGGNHIVAGNRVAVEYQARWDALKRDLVVVHDHSRMPSEQMAIDESWAREVAQGHRRPTLRLWEWGGPAVVVGRFQSAFDEVNLDVARQLGFAVVRRCTGGGAMFIEPGNTITYSLYAPLDFVQGVSIEESYKLCDWWLVEALRELGLDVRFAGLNDIASQYGKIGGAAQRRFPEGGGAVLHHVTMAYDIDARKMGRVLNTSREKMSDKAVKSAVKRVDPMKSQTGLSRGEIIDHLIAWFGKNIARN